MAEVRAIYVPHHDDPPCEAKLVSLGGGNYCPECNLHPDMQSVALWLYCPNCVEPLNTDQRCPKCNQHFQRPR